MAAERLGRIAMEMGHKKQQQTAQVELAHRIAGE